MPESFHGEEFALKRDDQKIGGNESVEGKKSQGGGAIDEDEFILIFHLPEEFPENLLPTFDIDKFDLYPYEVLIGGDQIQMGNLRGDDDDGSED